MADKREKIRVPKRSAGLVISPPAPRPVNDNPSLPLFREAKDAQSAVDAAATTPTHHPPPTYHPPPAR